ncbi:hypothetical protein GCM10010232_31210 [Streptomyces amakusaensis]
MSLAHIAPVTNSSRSAVPLHRMTAWDRTAIVLLGAAGFAFSYDALRQIAVAMHARESLSYLFPLFIDGFIAYGVRAIVLLRNRPFLSRLYTWFLFLAATAASLGANALHAITLNRSPQSAQSALYLTDSVVAVLSMLAPLALAGSVHLYILMARAAELSVPDRADDGPGPVREAVRPPAGSTENAEVHPAGSEPTAEATAAPSAPGDVVPAVVDLRKHGRGNVGEHAPNGPGSRPSGVADRGNESRALADGMPVGGPDGEVPTPPPAAAEELVPEPVRDHSDGCEPSVPDDVEPPQDREPGGDWLEDLLPVARAAYQESGRISRDAIKEAVRARQPISNDRLGILLSRLKDEVEERSAPPARTSTALW